MGGGNNADRSLRMPFVVDISLKRCKHSQGSYFARAIAPWFGISFVHARRKESLRAGGKEKKNSAYEARSYRIFLFCD